MTQKITTNMLLGLLVSSVAINSNNCSVHAFTGMKSLSRNCRGSNLARSPSVVFMSDDRSKDDEIAKLEEQLRKLKEEKTSEETAVAATTTTTIEEEEEDEEMISLEEASMDMFLSEGWKEARSNYDPSNTATKKRQEEEQGNLIGTVAKLAGGILALVLFSQIPVGQEDLSKYSSIKSGPATTTIDLGDTNKVKGQTMGDL